MGFLRKILDRGAEEKPPIYCAAILAAAGSSSRMGGENKLFMDLNGVPVVVHSLNALENCPEVSEIIVVTRQEDIVAIGNLCRDYGLRKVSKVVRGGEKRAASVLSGILEISGKADLIAIHDAARPLATPGLISETIIKASQYKAAAPVVAVKDTIKVCRGGIIEKTLDRDTLYAVQTPQVFDADLIKGALTKALESKIFPTDDCAAVEAIGVRVAATQGDYENIKITTLEDIAIARAILEGRQDL